MRVRCRLELEYPDKKLAELVYKSVKVDDDGFISSSLKENVLVAEMEAESPSSLLHTLDDYLSCISVAEKVNNVRSKR